jgi:hypothetical protein
MRLAGGQPGHPQDHALEILQILNTHAGGQGYTAQVAPVATEECYGS